MEATLQHWPQPMARFGKNPYGENMYRIVFAPSRRQIVYGEWPDGSKKASMVPAYPEAGRSWILERWMTPFEYSGCTPETWNMTMTMLGPYPDRGEYQICHVFDPVLPTDCNLDKLIMWIEAGRKFSFTDNVEAIKDKEAQRVKDVDREKEALIRNSLPAFGLAPMSGFGGGRGSKTHRPMRLTAEEAGMPTKGGQTRFIPSQKKTEVLVSI